LDGTPVVVRPLVPSDREAYLRAFARFGPETRYRRFLGPHGDLSEREVRYFTEVDHRDHEALLALDPVGGDVIGVARYIRVPGRRDTAEFAVTVVDDRQGRGVGTVLMHELVERARRSGIRRAEVSVLTTNRPCIELFRGVGRVRVVGADAGVQDLLVELRDRPGDLAEALRWAAANRAHGGG
jgi:GNAT superfamily N-acetyltransferase